MFFRRADASFFASFSDENSVNVKVASEAMKVNCVHCSASVPITNQQELEAEWNASQGARSLELQCGKCQGALTVTFRDPPAAFVQTSSLMDDHHNGRSFNIDDSTDYDDVE